jgi:hypothetical protein
VITDVPPAAVAPVAQAVTVPAAAPDDDLPF